MTCIEEKMLPTPNSVLPALPKREDKVSQVNSTQDRKSPRSVLEAKLSLLLRLVERVKALSNVSIKNVPYLTQSGMVVNVPGPFSLRSPALGSDQSSAAVPSSEHKGPVDDDGHDDAEDDAPDEEELGMPEIHEDDLIQPSGQLNREKFVVRNEFGHVRIQHIL